MRNRDTLRDKNVGIDMIDKTRPMNCDNPNLYKAMLQSINEAIIAMRESQKRMEVLENDRRVRSIIKSRERRKYY